MSITLDDVSSLPHLSIMERLLDHSRMTKPDALEMMVTYLRDDREDALKKMEGTRGCHVPFVFLEKLSIHNLAAKVEANGVDAQVMHHRACALRSHLIYLGCTFILVAKSAYHIDVIYLTLLWFTIIYHLYCY